jgi:FKBP-type peptidyl-prolyl cis-trans isomerase
MERLLSIIALVVAIGIGAYGYVTMDRQRGDIAALNQKVEGLSKTLNETQKALTGLNQELAPLLQMIRQQTQAAPSLNLDMAKLTPEANAKYLADYAQQDRVQKLPSGLMYRVLKEGPAGGKSPALGSTITINYEGKFIDGTILDSSEIHGGPQALPLDGLIPGWIEALPKMKEGDEWELVLPASLAYGEAGQGPVPGGQVLIFKIELIKAGA